MPDRIADRMPEWMSDRMLSKMSGYMSEIVRIYALKFHGGDHLKQFCL